MLTVAEIGARSAIVEVVDTDGRVLAVGERITVEGEGVRPEPRDGRVVLVVRPREGGGYEPIRRKKGEGDL
jgi:hypothetical protein